MATDPIFCKGFLVLGTDVVPWAELLPLLVESAFYFSGLFQNIPAKSTSSSFFRKHDAGKYAPCMHVCGRSREGWIVTQGDHEK
jgi:hypothetical protein